MIKLKHKTDVIFTALTIDQHLQSIIKDVEEVFV